MEQSNLPYNPEYGENMNDAPFTQPSSPVTRKLKAWQYSRSVKIFSIIDGLFCFIWFIYLYWPAIFSGLLIISGYYGAKKYNTNLLIGYTFYILSDIVFKGYLMYYIAENQISAYAYFFNIFGIFVQLYICRIIYQCYKSIKALLPSELNELKNGWISPRVVFAYW